MDGIVNGQCDYYMPPFRGIKNTPQINDKASKTSENSIFAVVLKGLES